MTVPCPRPSVIFEQLYQVLLVSIKAVICSLTDFTRWKLQIKHSNMLTVVSYKNVPMVSTVYNQCSVIVIPVHEINFSICLPVESTLALPRDLF